MDYENLDNHQTGIHDYFKFLKFGFCARHRYRLPARPARPHHARGRAARSCKPRDGKFPWTYLGKPLAEILEPLDMSVDEFVDDLRPVHQQEDLQARRAPARWSRTATAICDKVNYDNP